MKFTQIFLVFGIAAFLSCQKSEFLVEEKLDVEKVVDQKKDSAVVVIEEDTTTTPVDDEGVKYIEYTDTSKVKLSPGFEKYLIRFRIDKDPTPNGYILYQYIKDIDSLIIHETFEAGKNLTGIEGFTNLRIFKTESLTVDKIDFSNNSKLEHFEYRQYPHCMGCNSLSSLVFGKQSNLKTLNLYGAHELSSVDFENLTKLKVLKIQTVSKLRYQDISACREIEKIDLASSNAGIILGRLPKLKDLRCGAYPHHVDFTKLPALESLSYGVSGRHTPDFSNCKELKNLHISFLENAKLDLSANKKLEGLAVTGTWTQTSIDLRNNVSLKKCVLTNSQLSTICVNSLASVDFGNWEKDDKTQYKVCE